MEGVGEKERDMQAESSTERPHAQDGKERDKEAKEENKGAGLSSLAQPPELWGCRGDCLQRSGLREERARAEGPATAGQRNCSLGSALAGDPWLSGAVLCPTPSGWPHSNRVGWGHTGEILPFTPFPACSAQHRCDAPLPLPGAETEASDGTDLVMAPKAHTPWPLWPPEDGAGRHLFSEEHRGRG